MKLNFFKKKQKEPEIIIYSDGSELVKKEPIRMVEPFTLAKYRLEQGAKDIGSKTAIKMYNSHKAKINNQWFNPSLSVNSGFGTIQHSFYNYQNVNYYECMFIAQDPLMNKILNLLSQTPFKKGGKIVGDFSAKQLEEVEKQVNYWKLQDLFIKALKESFTCGGCLVYLDFGTNEILEEPLDLTTANMKRFKGFRLIQAINCSAIDVETINPASPDYMKPKKWYIIGLGVVHRSRLLYFAQNKQPDVLKPLSMYFGYPLTQLIKQDVANSNIISQGIAELMGKFRYNFIKTPKSNFTTANASSFKARLEFDLNAKDNYGYSVLSDEEEVIQQQTNLSGLRENHEMSFLLISAKTSIPYTEIMGKSAEGMNATGTGDRKQWYDKIEVIRNSIKYNLLVCYGIIAGLDDGKFKIFEDYTFEPLEELTEKEQVEVLKAKTEIGKELIETYGTETKSILDWLKTDKNSGLDNVEIDLNTPNLADYDNIDFNKLTDEIPTNETADKE